MKIKALLIAFLLIQQVMAQSYKKIHDDAILVDTHNDILMKPIDLGFSLDQDLSGSKDYTTFLNIH